MRFIWKQKGRVDFLLLSVFLGLVQGGTAFGTDQSKSCSNWFENLEVKSLPAFGKSIPIKEIPRTVRFTLPEKVLENEVILGVSDLHYYLYIDGVRFDGETLRAVRWGEVDGKIRNGFLFRFPHVSQAQIAKLKELASAEAGKTSLTCVNAACKLLRDGAGFSIGDQKRPGVLASTTLERLFKHGFSNAQGEPVPMEVFRYRLDDGTSRFASGAYGSGKDTPEDLKLIMALYEKELVEEYVQKVVLPVTAMGTALGGAWYLLFVDYQKVK